MGLIDVISKPLEGFKGVLGVSVKHLDTGETADVNGKIVFPTASVFKLPVIVEFYRQVDEGKISFDLQVPLRDGDKVPGSGVLKELSEGMTVSFKDLLSLMMIVSDNTATDILVKKIGFENINDSMIDLGLPNTKVTKYCREILFDLVDINYLELEDMSIEAYEAAAESMEYAGSWSLEAKDNNVSTPNEMTRLLELIVTEEAASRDGCQAILGLMAKCQTGAYRIPKYLPRKEVSLQRKTGSLPGIRNDVGVVNIRETGERYILSCFTWRAEDNYMAEEVIAKASKGIYEYFKG